MENLKTKKSFKMIMVIVIGLALVVGVGALLFNLQSGDTAQIVGKVGVNAKKASSSESGGVALTQDGVTALLESLTSEIDTLTTEVNNLKSNSSSVLDAYPIGSIYISTSSTNPGTIFGGTWEAYGQGRTLVGVGTGTDSNSTSQSFDAGQTGGAYTHTLTTAQLPIHDHSFSASSTSSAVIRVGTGSTQAVSNVDTFPSGFIAGQATRCPDSDYHLSLTSNTTANSHYYTDYTLTGDVIVSGTSGNSGGGSSHNNIQPYIATYMWKRTS